MLRITDTAAVETQFDGEELLLLIPAPLHVHDTRRSRAKIEIWGDDEPTIRWHVTATAAYADDPDAVMADFQRRLTCETEDVPAEIDEAEKLAKSFRFRHSDTDALVDECLRKLRDPSIPTLSLTPPERGPVGGHVEWDGVVIRLPRNVALTVLSTEPVSVRDSRGELTVLAGGDVSVRDVGGPLAIAVSGGGVEARDVNGSARIVSRTMTGNTRLSSSGLVWMTRMNVSHALGGGRCTPPHQLHSPAGIDIRGVSGDLRAETDWSDMVIWDVRGDIHAGNVRGDISLALTSEYIDSDRRAAVSADHGDIHLSLQPSQRPSIRLETDFGIFDVRGEELREQFVSHNLADAPLYVATARREDLPDPRVRAETAAGSIYIRQGSMAG